MPPSQFISAIGGHPLVSEILWERGFRDAKSALAFLHADQYQPSTDLLPDLATAVTRVVNAIAKGEKIRIWGDFDADGQTATSLLFLGLSQLRAIVDYTIPNRALYNHGLNADGIVRAAADGVAVLITCDCAVTDFEAVVLAQSLGLDVIITDHHDLALDGNGKIILPAALAVVNPKHLPKNHALAHLPGVGVAYKVLERLYAHYNLPAPTQLLDLVAIGIVSDVAEQSKDTRYLLQLGLAQLHTQPRLGIQYLLQPTGLPAQQLDTDAIGFHIGPRLNSAGRLDSAEISVQLLTTEDSTVAQTIAQRIETLNQERKILQRKVEDEALSLLHKNPQWSNEPIVVLSGSNWHPSVVGVVASSLTQQLQKPVALIAISSESTTALARGSARSFADFDIHTAIAAQHDLIETSGGHPMAAGFSIKTEHITLFRQRINQYARKQTADSAKTAAVSTPFNIAWHEVSLNLCLELERLAPFGAGNPRPMLNSQNITVARIEPVGSDGRHQALWLKNDVGHIAKVMWWRSANQPAPSADADYDVVFTLQPNWYRGKVMMQITLHQLILRNTSLADQSANQHIITSRFRIIDLRREQDPAAIWRNLAETYGEEHIVHYGKQMHPFAQTITTPAPTSLAAQMLVFWVAPPSLHTLYALLRQYSPQFVALMPHTLPLETDTPDGFMRSLKGMIKVADKRGDALDDSDVIERMAARICHKPETIIEGITCATAPTATVSANLALMLEETRAYRHFVAVAPAESVFRIED